MSTFHELEESFYDSRIFNGSFEYDFEFEDGENISSEFNDTLRSSNRLVYPRGKGMFITTLRGTGLSPIEMGRAIRDYGISWVAIERISMVGRLFNPPDLTLQYINELRQVNPSFGVWIWGWPNPSNFSRFVSIMVESALQVRVNGIIVDAEKSWKNRANEATNLMSRLLPDAHRSGLSVGVTSFGAPKAHPAFPWSQFAVADFGIPQIYNARNNLASDYPRRSVADWRSKGFRRIVPASAAFNKTAAQMRNLLNNTPTPDGAIIWWHWASANMRRHYWEIIRNYRIGVGASVR